MKKLLMVALVLAVAASLVATPVLAGKNGQAGKSNVAHLYLYEKNASWEIVEDGAWGKMKYNLSGPTFDFVFNGHGLEAYTNYSLIYYADFEDRYVNWGGNNPGALIAIGTTNPGGQLHLADSIDLGMDLPDPDDANAYYHNYADPDDPHYTGDGYATAYGAKIWLVPSDCYDAGAKKVDTWSPSRFLFETDLITYTDTDVPPPSP